MQDDEPTRKPASHETGTNVDALSVDELKARIALLQAEIARLTATIAARHATKSAADAAFKF